jgi:mannosyltransferase
MPQAPSASATQGVGGSVGTWELASFGAILVGLLLRLYQADYNFDTDEVFSVRLASSPFADVISLSLADRPHPPLYNVLLHFWLLMFGTSEVAARTLSVLFSAGFLIVSLILLRRFVSRGIAAGVLLLLAVSPFFVYYGEQARPYALIALLTAVNLLAYFRLLQSGERKQNVIGWALTCALLVYAHYLGILTIALEIVFALLSLTAARWRIAVVGTAAALLITPWAIAAMAHVLIARGDPLSQISWMAAPNLTDFIWFYVGLFGSPAQVRWLAILLVLLALAFVVRLVRCRQQLPTEQLFLLVMAFGAPLLCWVISIWGPKSVFAARQLMAPAISLVFVLALCLQATPRIAAAFLVAALAFWMIGAVPAAFPRNAKPPWREIARDIDASHQSANVYTEEPWISDPLGYYRREGKVELVGKTKAVKLEHDLVVCRPHFCQDFESEESKSRVSLVASWTWGLPGEPRSDLSILRLYQLAAR